MFRVPKNPDHPTFDDVEHVGVGRWLTSSREQRVDWAKRRNMAARLAAAGQQAGWTPAPPQPRADLPRRGRPPRPVQDPVMRRVDRLTRISLWGANVQLALVLGGVALLLAAGLAIVWVVLGLLLG